MALDLLIFDCDGVLVDSESIALAILRDALERRGLVLALADVQREFQGRSLPSVVARLHARGVAFPPEAQEAMVAELRERFARELQATQGIEALIDRVRVPYCVASSSRTDRLRHSLDVAGLLGRFEGRLYSADRVASGKPSPDLFLLAAREAGAKPSRCLVIEDSVPGLEAARAAGMGAIAFIGGSHLTDPVARTRLAALCPTVAHDAHELARMLDTRGALAR